MKRLTIIGIVATAVFMILYHVSKSGLHNRKENELKNNSNVHNILIWTHNYTVPFVDFGKGNRVFVKGMCPFTNCYLTNNRSAMNIIDWDALLFHAPEYAWDHKPEVWHHGFPAFRSPSQIYIFSTIESSNNYPVTKSRWDGYFNWTMTYRLDSEVPWIYFIIEDVRGKAVGPAENIQWISNMDDVSSETKSKLQKKNRMVAWFVSNCKTSSKREVYANRLKIELEKLNHTLDIYGKCAEKKCQNEQIEGVNSCIPELGDYYFYLSFENSFSKYYVTEKLSRPMQNNVVPVVWGGADYSNFAPPNSYINAREYEPKKLAELMIGLASDIGEYSKYFKWTNHYMYRGPYENIDMNPMCKLCEALNDPNVRSGHAYENFRHWWNE